MTTDDLEARLRKAHRGATEQSGREALEQQVMARFDAVHDTGAAPKRPALPRPWGVRRWAALLALGSGVALALGAPAQLRVEVGKTVELSLPAGERPDDLGEAVGELARREGAQVLDLWIRARARPSGTTVELTVWGDRLPDDARFLALLRTRWPHAVAEVHALDGQLRTTVARRLGAELHWLHASAEERARARQALIARLRAENPGAEVEVEVDEVDGRTRVKKQVRRQAPGHE